MAAPESVEPGRCRSARPQPGRGPAAADHAHPGDPAVAAAHGGLLLEDVRAVGVADVDEPAGAHGARICTGAVASTPCSSSSGSSNHCAGCARRPPGPWPPRFGWASSRGSRRRGRAARRRRGCRRHDRFGQRRGDAGRRGGHGASLARGAGVCKRRGRWLQVTAQIGVLAGPLGELRQLRDQRREVPGPGVALERRDEDGAGGSGHRAPDHTRAQALAVGAADPELVIEMRKDAGRPFRFTPVAKAPTAPSSARTSETFPAIRVRAAAARSDRTRL